MDPDVCNTWMLTRVSEAVNGGGGAGSPEVAKQRWGRHVLLQGFLTSVRSVLQLSKWVNADFFISMIKPRHPDGRRETPERRSHHQRGLKALERSRHAHADITFTEMFHFHAAVLSRLITSEPSHDATLPLRSDPVASRRRSMHRQQTNTLWRK